MTNQVKVPKEIQELFFEAAAFFSLAIFHSRWLIPSPKTFYYALRGEKVDAMAWRTLHKVFPKTAEGVWHYDINSGVANEVVDDKPKAPRAPRKPKVKDVQPGQLPASQRP